MKTLRRGGAEANERGDECRDVGRKDLGERREHVLQKSLAKRLMPFLRTCV